MAGNDTHFILDILLMRLFAACLCRLGKSIGFTDDALATFQLRKEIYTFAPYHEVLNSQRNFPQQFEVPSMLSTIYEETRSGSYQLLSDGHLDLILDKCSDYWDGQELRRMTDAVKLIIVMAHN